MVALPMASTTRLLPNECGGGRGRETWGGGPLAMLGGENRESLQHGGVTLPVEPLFQDAPLLHGRDIWQGDSVIIPLGVFPNLHS